MAELIVQEFHGTIDNRDALSHWPGIEPIVASPKSYQAGSYDSNPLRRYSRRWEVKQMFPWRAN